jgi:predicted nucleic acid-binding protein
VVTTGSRIARIAGHLLAHTGRDGDDAVDALVIATSVRLGGGIVLTHDPDDLRALASRHRVVEVLPI